MVSHKTLNAPHHRSRRSRSRYISSSAEATAAQTPRKLATNTSNMCHLHSHSNTNVHIMQEAPEEASKSTGQAAIQGFEPQWLSLSRPTLHHYSDSGFRVQAELRTGHSQSIEASQTVSPHGSPAILRSMARLGGTVQYHSYAVASFRVQVATPRVNSPFKVLASSVPRCTVSYCIME